IFLIVYGGVKFKISSAEKETKLICLYDETTSAVSKGEITKLLNSFNESHIDWKKILKDDLENYDYLVLSKGNLTQTEEEIIFKFLKSGAGLVLFLPKIYNDDFLKKIGIRTYKIYGDDLRIEWNDEIFQNPLQVEYVTSRGVLVKTGFAGSIKRPDKGNVFPERIPVRDFTVLSKVIDKGNNFLGSSVVLVKHWLNPWDIKDKTPKKWLLISGQGFNFERSFYQQIAQVLKQPFVIKDLRASYPIYENGEDVELALEVFNLNMRNEQGEFLIEVLNQDEVIYSVYNKRKFIPGLNELSFKVKKEFKPGFYELKCSFYSEGRVVDYFKNAFLVKDKSWDDQGIDFKIKKDKFLINGKRSFLWGVNYYESSRGELMWLWPNLYRINQDFKLMNKLGFKIVRIHYHHPKWFEDYLSIIDSKMAEFFPDKKYLPCEEDLRILDSTIYLAKLNDLIVCFDLFTLVPHELGNPSGWISMDERITDKEKIKHQLEFVKILAQRYKNVKGITWDLWNEPRIPEEMIPQLKQWVGVIIQEFRKNGDNHLITLGGNDSLYIENELDYISIHSERIDIAPLSSKPVIIQEFWLDEDLNKEQIQFDDLQEIITDLKVSNYQGFMPWQWTRQSRLWDQSEPEKWDDDLGLFLREDSSFKPTTNLLFFK
ncbi:MAG: cellulase family glycosylhydrolase, partial [Candidatus Saelkia tenebricola]|nr:cellulase family glycosylhydrolase [Candidatus Saelkia tenebricola]